MSIVTFHYAFGQESHPVFVITGASDENQGTHFYTDTFEVQQ